MVSICSWWVLLVAWVIAFGLSVFWARKAQEYHRLLLFYKTAERQCFCGSKRRSNDKEGYYGHKTSLLSDMAIKATAEPINKYGPVLITNYPINDEKSKFDVTKKTIEEWKWEIHANAVEHGWYDGPEKNFGELLMLVVTEVAEVMEEYRKGRHMKESYLNEEGKICGVPSELADIVIRVMDICAHYDIDLEQAIAQKHEYNKSRPYKHGGKKC